MKLPRLKWFKRQAPEMAPAEVMDDDMAVLESTEVIVAIQPKPKGRVIRHTKNKQWQTEISSDGKGRVIRVMPLQLQQIQEAQNAAPVELPKVEDD